MSNKTYNILKWIAIVGLPPVAAFIGTVGTATGWEYTGITVTIITALDTLLGAWVGVSNSTYNKTQKALTDSSTSILNNATEFKEPIDTDDYDLEGHFNG